jgi:outer membrane lipoprotein-sorting protein
LNKKQYEKIKLTPEDKKKPYFQIELKIEPAKYEIHQVDISFKNGMKQQINLTSQKPNEVYTNKMFEFVPEDHAGITVIDLR